MINFQVCAAVQPNLIQIEIEEVSILLHRWGAVVDHLYPLSGVSLDDLTGLNLA